MATIICGANTLNDPRWNGRTVTDVRAAMREALNIPEQAAVSLNGRNIGQENPVLRDGDELEFVKAAGEKGATARRSGAASVVCQR